MQIDDETNDAKQKRTQYLERQRERQKAKRKAILEAKMVEANAYREYVKSLDVNSQEYQKLSAIQRLGYKDSDAYWNGYFWPMCRAIAIIPIPLAFLFFGCQALFGSLSESGFNQQVERKYGKPIGNIDHKTWQWMNTTPACKTGRRPTC